MDQKNDTNPWTLVAVSFTASMLQQRCFAYNFLSLFGCLVQHSVLHARNYRLLVMLFQSQFLFLLGQTAVNVMSRCEFPKIFSCTVFFYTITILILFLNFYRKAYLRKRKDG